MRDTHGICQRDFQVNLLQSWQHWEEVHIVNNVRSYSIRPIRRGTTKLLRIGGVVAGFVCAGWFQSTDMLAQEVTLSPAIGFDDTPQDWGMSPLFQPDRGLRGAASCAASSCHGGPRPAVATPTTASGSEYTLWLESDPHARSWTTLASDPSHRILTKLGIVSNGAIIKQRDFDNCLACHNTSRELSDDRMTPKIAEGVGCELCHGPAQPWYDRHYQGNPPPVVGMTDIQPLVQRAKLCATCHVGGRDRDMNHDIIAAGHPALYFDMAVYHEGYPKHWRESTNASPDFRARLWLAGQVAIADAELELLEARASKSHSVSVWPELSMYRCTDCHVALNGVPRLPNEQDRKLVVAGRASLREWNLSGIGSLSNHLGRKDGLPLEMELQNLKQLLQATPPNASKILPAVQSLRRLLAAQFYPVGDCELLGWNRHKLRSLCQQQLVQLNKVDEWELAAKFYISAWSSRAQFDSKELFDAMRSMRRALVFPADRQSPSFPRPKNSAGPPNLVEWRTALKQAAVGLLESDSP